MPSVTASFSRFTIEILRLPFSTSLMYDLSMSESKETFSWVSFFVNRTSRNLAPTLVFISIPKVPNNSTIVY
ncbi:hypothetical protein SAMN05421740_10585 [Parapedobacter koreensis]|uniref:Uncharacterized protein n=1 Tax=Parapedobacter koreensis TaxID=332977 RepID=A0A1H7PYY0_9SPHI|nr:hypothetical protein SAMN05421740_10585 [Parapedobacter koreensis]